MINLTTITFFLFASITTHAASNESQHAANLLRELSTTAPTDAVFEKKVFLQEHSQTEIFRPTFKGIPVLGYRLTQTTSNKGKTIHSDPIHFEISTTPTIDASEAVAIARANINTENAIVTAPKLLILQTSNHANLVYKVIIQKGEFDNVGFHIDAHTGKILSSFPLEYEIASVDVYDASNPPENAVDPKSGAPISFNYKMTKTVSGSVAKIQETSSLNALRNANATLSYYWNQHHRDSFDGHGAQILNLVKVGKKFRNAFWSSQGNFMAYGEGDGVIFGDFTKALDVAGHEMTHGVVSQTADLIYNDESGALNEATADIFGKMVEGKEDWEIGKGLFLDTAKGAHGLRSLSDPSILGIQIKGADGQPVTYKYPTKLSEKITANTQDGCVKENDFCWVHANSTIYSHVFYNIYKNLGKEITTQVFYNGLLKMSESTDMNKAADAVVSACKSLYETSICATVINEFTASEFKLDTATNEVHLTNIDSSPKWGDLTQAFFNFN